MPKLSKISFIILFALSLSAVSLAASNILTAVNDNGNELVIYPNPVLGNDFQVKSEKEITEITVINVLGQPVYSQKVLNLKIVSIELETRDRGVFIVQVKTTDGTTATKRILLK